MNEKNLSNSKTVHPGTMWGGLVKEKRMTKKMMKEARSKENEECRNKFKVGDKVYTKWESGQECHGTIIDFWGKEYAIVLIPNFGFPYKRQWELAELHK
jgi:hypothetical protein